jgi:hypothetical protein
MAFVATRQHRRESASRATPLAAFTAAEPASYFLEPGVPTANVCQRPGKYSAFMPAGSAFQDQLILSELVGELFDFESAAHPAHVNAYRL